MSALDAGALLSAGPVHLLADRVVEAARSAAGAPAALYLIDIDGSRLSRVAGDPELPPRVELSRGLGPEMAPGQVEVVRDRIRESEPRAVVQPVAVRDRAVAVLVARDGAPDALQALARAVGPALELAGGYTDRLAVARRSQPISPAAEMQQAMLPPRIARVRGGELAADMMPAYDVGGDWFDHSENADGVWLAVADAVGKGARATGLSAIALGAVRAARRNGEGVEEAAALMHRSLCERDGTIDYVTAAVCHWSREDGQVRYVNAGHPRPLVADPAGRVREIDGDPTYPLGLFERDRQFTATSETLAPGERLILYSDGISERRRLDGSLLDVAGIAAAVAGAADDSAVTTVLAVQAAVLDAAPGPLRDDATLLVLRRDG